MNWFCTAILYSVYSVCKRCAKEEERKRRSGRMLNSVAVVSRLLGRIRFDSITVVGGEGLFMSHTTTLLYLGSTIVVVVIIIRGEHRTTDRPAASRTFSFRTLLPNNLSDTGHYSVVCAIMRSYVDITNVQKTLRKERTHGPYLDG